MTIQNYQIPATATAIFREVSPRVAVMADICVANLQQIFDAEFTEGAIPDARWRAHKYESADNFKRRITADLTKDGTLNGQPPGVVVTIYARPGFFERNVHGAA